MSKTFNEYEELILGTAFYPGVGEGSQMALAYTALGLVGEGGEFSEKVKKWIRDGEIDKTAAARELGDVLWYLTASAKELGFSLQDIAEMNMVKLLSRKNRGVLGGSGDDR